MSFPRISLADGSVPTLSALHAGIGGVLAFEGDPLLRLTFARSGDSPRPLDHPQWKRLERWIPRAEAAFDDDLHITITYCAPGGYEPLAHGGFILCEITNQSTAALNLDVVADLRITGASLHVASPRRMHGTHRAAAGVIDRGVALEVGTPGVSAGLGVTTDGEETQFEIVNSNGELSLFTADMEAARRAGEVLHVRISTHVPIRAGRTVKRAIYFGVGRDRDSALGHAAHLSRVGATRLLREARLELTHLTRRVSDVKLSEIINRNLLYNHYCGLARGLDDDRLYPVSSRSPLHTPGAAVNERETLFWTLPCITLTDPLLAREVLRDAFELYSAQPGLQWRYLDGGVITPGFCLEQALLYPLALDRYVRETGDDSILDDPLVQDVLREIDGALDSRLHPDLLLCNTEVLPDGEPADQPYPSLGNIMLWAYAQALPRIWRAEDGEAPSAFEGAAEDISAAIWQRFMADFEGAQIFVRTTDLAKQSAVYDDPLMSLSLMSFFGFCKPDDPTLLDTMMLLRSTPYPFWRAGAAPGLASRRHPAAPSLAALCADLLGARKNDALRILRSLQLTDGIASDSYDAATGATAAGPHAAALAGLLAWSLVHAIDGPTKPEGKARK
ncbi:MAG: hypothetical protein ABIS27_10485 [Longimicrobiales bacterium]